MTGPRVTDDLAQKERRRDYGIMSVSSRLRAKELEATCKHIASEKSQTQCLFRRRKEELLSSMKTRVKQLEKIEASQPHVDVTCQALSPDAHSRATDPYPVSFGRANQKNRADVLLEQYHGRRRKSFEFEDAPLRRAAHAQLQPRWHHHHQQQLHGARRMSKEFEDLPSMPRRPPPPPPPPPLRPSERALSQRRKSREYEDIRFGGRLSPLLARRRKSKEFEDLAYGRPHTRRLFAAPAADHGDDAAAAPSSDPHRRTPAPPSAASPTSPKSPKGAAHKNKFRMTYPVDKITHGAAEFTTVHGSRSPEGGEQNHVAPTGDGLAHVRHSVAFVKLGEEQARAAAAAATVVIAAAAIPAAAADAAMATVRENLPSRA